MARSGSSGDFTLEKGLPSNPEAERAILGAILLDNGMINAAAERLRREDFFLDSHRRIYEQMLHLYETGRAIDPITLQDALRRSGELELVGGTAYIASLFDGVPRFANIDNYTKIVKDKSILRRLITASNQIMATCFDDEDEAEIILDQAERSILAIGEERIKQGFVPISEVARKQLEYIEEIAGREQLITGVATGFGDLDYLTSGLQRGDLIIIAARPSMGKCLVADSEVVLADGSVVTIEEIYRRKSAQLVTLGDDFRFRLTSPSAFVDDGIKPVFKLTTRLGRSVESTASHPFLTIDGWRKLEELRVGDRIAVPRCIEIFGTKDIDPDRLQVLADSSRSEVPAGIFSLARSHVAQYLNRVFTVHGRVNTAPVVSMSFATGSERLARQVQHLLLRFGIIGRLGWSISDIFRSARIRFGTSTDVGTLITPRRGREIAPVCLTWRLEITQAESVRRFFAEIGAFTDEENFCKLLDPCMRLSENWRQNHTVASHIYWDEIDSIEYRGEKQVYDLTVPETHNFVANDICVHNTAFCLNIAQNAATRPQFNGRKAVVGIFSLEMSKEQLVHRLLCSQARIDAHRLRSGMLGKEDWKKLAYAVSELAEARIFLDDTPGINVLEMRAKARRLKNEQKALDLLIVDYLQLMSGRGRNESRQQEVSQISRELKILAKELDVPLVALSQLSRAPEARTGNRPQLSDLRESGCLAGESLVTMADTGMRIPIGELAGKSGFKVWALNENNMQVEAATVSRAFSTGIKPVFRLTTRLGRSIRATANHKFRSIEGWKRLDELRVGERLAMPRRLPGPETQTMTDAELALLGHLIGDGCTLPRHAVQYTTREADLAEAVADLTRQVFGAEVEPRIKQERTWYQVYLSSTRRHTHGVRSRVSEWLSDLGVWGLRSYEKRIPDRVFMQPAAAIGLFLRHLWATDGCIQYHGRLHYPSIYYATSSPALADGVQTLLLRLGINATVSRHTQTGKGRDQLRVTVSGKPDLERFISLVGAAEANRSAHLTRIAEFLPTSKGKTNRDVIPRGVWPQLIIPSLGGHQLSSRLRSEIFGSRSSLNTLQTRNLTRERAARIADALRLKALSALASSDVYWDEILSVEPDGETEVYDLTVDGLHNFEACNSFPHNSIEQDADIVMFIYREDVYKPDTDKQNIAEIIIGKQRNGPTGSVELVFLKQLTRFEDKFRE
ncbi:MAG: replicative DNA helicase [Blastocatellales bacterium]|nr:replicative DNA helicase [Blastocatellales bacterium]